MKKMTTILVILLSIAMLPYVSYGAEQSGHVDMDLEADTAAYCGVKRDAEPWTLSVAAVNGSGDVATLRLEVQDGSGTNFKVPANSSFSFRLDMGGVPGLDQLVRLTGTPGGALEGVATARARSGAQDPFDNDGAKDRFCLSVDEGSGGGEETVGAGSPTTSLAVPDSWVSDGDGSDGGQLDGPD